MTNSDGASSDAPAGDAPERPVAVVAAHGDLAAGLVSAVAQITGRGALLLPMSNRGLGAGEIEARLRAAVDGAPAGAPIRAVFTDLPGGSCTMAARRVQRERPELSVATGVNLAALLDFVCAQGVPGAGDCAPDVAGDPTPSVVARAVERGRAALAVAAVPAAPIAGR